MSNMKRCDAGHYWDADQYAACPYCSSMTRGTQGGGIDRTPTSAVRPEAGETKPTEGWNIKNEETKAPYDEDVLTRGDTISVDNNGMKRDKRFIVGWLVGIKGDYKNTAFELYDGTTHIGRNRSCPVCLDKDLTISRNQATISFDPVGRAYYMVCAQDASKNFHINKTIFMSAGGQQHVLSAYDRIRMGRNEFVFIPLCTEKFIWPELQSELDDD